MKINSAGNPENIPVLILNKVTKENKITPLFSKEVLIHA